jgi:hypothetical protein
MNRLPRKRFTPLGDLLDGVLEQALPETDGLRARLAAEAFHSAAGPAVAGRCTVLGIKGDILQVSVDTPRWRNELQRLSADYLRRVNETLLPSFRLTGFRFLGPQKKRKP